MEVPVQSQGINGNRFNYLCFKIRVPFRLCSILRGQITASKEGWINSDGEFTVEVLVQSQAIKGKSIQVLVL